jgi:hypothetical protein
MATPYGISVREGICMSSARRTSIAAGVLFIIATVAFLVASGVEPALTGAGALAGLVNHSDRLALAAILYLVAAGTSVGIAVVLYPLLRTVDAALALGSVVFRTIEAVCYTVAVVSLLSVLPLGRQFVTAPADLRPSIRTLAEAVVSARDHAVVVGVVAFSTGALLYYLVFYRSRLVPRWLSSWGLIGTLLMLTACVLALFGDRPVTGYTWLILPIAVQEMVFAAWVLIRGFEHQPAQTPAPRSPYPTVEDHVVEDHVR